MKKVTKKTLEYFINNLEYIRGLANSNLDETNKFDRELTNKEVMIRVLEITKNNMIKYRDGKN